METRLKGNVILTPMTVQRDIMQIVLQIYVCYLPTVKQSVQSTILLKIQQKPVLVNA